MIRDQAIGDTGAASLYQRVGAGLSEAIKFMQVLDSGRSRLIRYREVFIRVLLFLSTDLFVWELKPTGSSGQTLRVNVVPFHLKSLSWGLDAG